MRFFCSSANVFAWKGNQEILEGDILYRDKEKRTKAVVYLRIWGFGKVVRPLWGLIPAIYHLL